MTQNVVILQVEMGDEAFVLLDEQLDGPERRGLVV